jgi:hypothetical protein
MFSPRKIGCQTAQPIKIDPYFSAGNIRKHKTDVLPSNQRVLLAQFVGGIFVFWET